MQLPDKLSLNNLSIKPNSPYMAVLLVRLLVFVLFLFLCFSNAKAQQTDVYVSHQKFFMRGMELLHKEKYAAAQKHFLWYESVAQNNLEKANAAYFAAICGMELFNDDAEQMLKSVITRFPETTKAKLCWYQLAKFYYRKKNNQAAAISFDRFDESYLTKQEIEEFYFTKGYVMFKVERYADAQKAFEKIKEVNGKYYDAVNYYYAYVLYKQNLYNDALAHFLRVKNHKTFGPLSAVYVAQIYFAKGQYQDVINYSDTIKNKDIADDVAGILGQAHYLLGNYEKSLPYMERFMAAAPVVPSINDYYRMGFVYYVNSKFNSAVEYLLKCNAENDTTAAIANYYLGLSYIQLNKKPQAKAALDYAYKNPVNDSMAEFTLLNLAKLNDELGFQADAISYYLTYINKYPESLQSDEARANLSNLLLNAKDYKEALKVLNQIKNPKQKELQALQRVCYYRAEELYLNNEYTDAENMFLKSLENPFDKKLEGLAYFWLAEINSKNQQYNSASTFMQKFQQIDEVKQTRFYFLSYYNLGYAYLKANQYDKAIVAFKEYTELDKKAVNPEVYTDAITRMADCFFVLRNYDKAIENYNVIITKALSGADYALYQKAIIQGVLNQNNLKETSLKQLINNYPKSTYIDDAIFELATMYLQTDQLNNALEAYNNIINNFPRSIYIRKALLNKGLVQYNANNDADALVTFKKLITDYTSSDEAREALVVIKNIFINKGEGEAYLEFIKVLPNVVVSASVQDSLSYESAFNAYKAGNCEKASKNFNGYITKFPGGFFILKAHYFKAECDFKLKRYDDAIISYEYVATSVRSDYSERSIRQSAVLYYMKKHYEKAYEYYSSLERIAGNKDNLQVALLGQMRSANYLNAADSASIAALKYINSGIAQKDGLIEARLLVGRMFMRNNKPDSAFAEFNYVLKETKNVFGAEAKYNLALIQFLRKDYKNTQKLIFELNEQFSSFEEWRVRAFLLLADTYLKTNEYFQAKATLQSILDVYEGEELRNQAKTKMNEVIAQEEASKKQEQQKIEDRIKQKENK